MRKKPQGEEFSKLAEQWARENHEGKLALAKHFGVTYDTMKHWISDAGLGGTKVAVEEARGNLTAEELLATNTNVQLDFVSFDIETSNLKADFSVLLSAAIKPFGQETIVFRADAYPSWYTSRADDRAIVQDIAEELRRHAIVITHYGSRFDIPFLRAKMTKYGLEVLPPMFGLDSYMIAKRNFQVSSRRLASLANYFDIGEKSGVEGQLWMDAVYNGNPESMNEIVAHNIKDVEILEKLAALSFPFVKFIPRL